jgi:hypothetical protein
MAPVYASWETNGERILHWGKLISITGSTQILIQAIGMIVGIMTVRLLPVKEYAWFTIANTMLGSLTLLSDCGISSGVMAEAGKDWQNKELVGKVLSTGLYMRQRFAFYGMVVTLPVLAYLLINNGAEWWQAALIISALIPAFYASLSDTLLEIPMKLHQSIAALQLNQLYATVGRLLLTTSSLLVLPFTFIALVANGLPRIWANIQLRKKIISYANAHSLPDHEIRKSIRVVVKRAIPGAIFFVLSGQINIWIISIFGNNQGVAQIGALARITVIFTIFSTLLNTTVVPGFAKLKGTNKNLLQYFIKANLICLMGCFILLLSVVLMSNPLLLVLGHSYAGLERELVLMALSSIVGLMAGTIYGMNTSRGWVISPVLSIPLNISLISIGAFIFNLTNINGVLLFTIWQSAGAFLMHLGYSLYMILQINTNPDFYEK